MQNVVLASLQLIYYLWKALNTGEESIAFQVWQ